MIIHHHHVHAIMRTVDVQTVWEGAETKVVKTSPSERPLSSLMGLGPGYDHGCVRQNTDDRPSSGTDWVPRSAPDTSHT